MLMARELYGLANRDKVEEILVRMMRPQVGARQIFKKLGFKEEHVLPEYVKDQKGTKQDLFVLRCELAALWQGETYSDGFYTITPLDDQAHGADDYITVQIDIPTPECGVYAMSFGQAVHYRNVAPKTGALLPGFVTLENQADALCQNPLTLNVFGTIGQGDDWVVAFPDPQDPYTAVVESGETETAGVVMEVQQTLPEGTYTMNVSANVFGTSASIALSGRSSFARISSRRSDA